MTIPLFIHLINNILKILGLCVKYYIFITVLNKEIKLYFHYRVNQEHIKFESSGIAVGDEVLFSIGRSEYL